MHADHQISGTLLVKYLFFLLGLCIALCTLACALLFVAPGHAAPCMGACSSCVAAATCWLGCCGRRRLRRPGSSTSSLPRPDPSVAIFSHNVPRPTPRPSGAWRHDDTVPVFYGVVRNLLEASVCVPFARPCRGPR
jgi:hypothetical protein